MVRVFLNEISLRGAPDRAAVCDAMLRILAIRRASPAVARYLYCSRETANTLAVRDEPLLASLSELPRDDKTSVLLWLTRQGPFLDEDRTPMDQDLYVLEGVEVTELGPGEAARLKQRGHDGRLFSFSLRETGEFHRSPLQIVQGFADEPVSTIEVENIWSENDLQDVAESAEPEPESWETLTAVCRERYPHLLIGEHCDRILAPLPFFPNVSRRTLDLLRVLNLIIGERHPDGSLSAVGESLRQMHFIGDKAWFTGESDQNERSFASEMTFPDPEDPTKKLQCFWHGKIKTPQFRIHFEWPPRLGGNRLRVAYIGPKVTKR